MAPSSDAGPATAPLDAAYVHATTADAVARWLGELGTARMLAVDTETTGWDPLLDRLELVQVSAGSDRPVLVLDAEHVDPRALAPILGSTDVLKVFHHGAFDLRFLAVAGVPVARVADTMLAQQLLDGGEAPLGVTSPYSLARMAAFRLGAALDKTIRDTFGDGPRTAAQLAYAADDAAATFAIFDQQWRELLSRGLFEVAKIEFAALPVLADLQLRGVAFDAARWRGVLGELEHELPALAAAAQDALVCDESPQDLFGPVPVNLESPEQVVAALQRLGLPVSSTREPHLRDHRGNPAIDALLRYREVSKVTTGWGGDWSERVVHARTGRVHADWRQIVGTGRISCSEPSLLQIPKEPRYRSCFGGAAGRALVIADYSQQELRILAAVSGDEGLREVFRRGGDLHVATAATAFGVDEAAVTAAQRAAAKALNFGLVYGMGAAGFARSTGRTLEEAQGIIARYFAAFPRVEAWLHAAETRAKRAGAIRTPLGRLRTMPADVPVATLARNAPIQGAGADMTKIALAEVERRLRSRFGHERGADGVAADGLVLVVHDELVAEVPAVDAEEAAVLVRDGMEAAARVILGEVPPAVDVVIRERWG